MRFLIGGCIPRYTKNCQVRLHRPSIVLDAKSTLSRCRGRRRSLSNGLLAFSLAERGFIFILAVKQLMSIYTGTMDPNKT